MISIWRRQNMTAPSLALQAHAPMSVLPKQS
jgi:hypothetical protein